MKVPTLQVGLILDWVNPVIEEMVSRLERAGVEVECIFPAKQPVDLANIEVTHPLYVIKASTQAAMSYAGALHLAGARTLNPYPTVVAARNKLICTAAMRRAGIPVPESWMIMDPQQAAPLLAAGPLIFKPYLGARGVGIHVVRSREELGEVEASSPLLVQRYHPNDGIDRKMYVTGGRLFGVKRAFPVERYEDKVGQTFEPGPEYHALAQQIGALFGMDLFSFDVVVSEGRRYVVDLGTFGSYMGVPDAPRLLGAYILAACERVVRGGMAVLTARGSNA